MRRQLSLFLHAHAHARTHTYTHVHTRTQQTTHVHIWLGPLGGSRWARSRTTASIRIHRRSTCISSRGATPTSSTPPIALESAIATSLTTEQLCGRMAAIERPPTALLSSYAAVSSRGRRRLTRIADRRFAFLLVLPAVSAGAISLVISFTQIQLDVDDVHTTRPSLRARWNGAYGVWAGHWVLATGQGWGVGMW